MKRNYFAILQDELKSEIDRLLALKDDYKTLTGTDYQAPGAGASKDNKKDKKKEKKSEKKPFKQAPKNEPVVATDDATKKQTRLGLEAKKDEALSDWYSQVNIIR